MRKNKQSIKIIIPSKLGRDAYVYEDGCSYVALDEKTRLTVPQLDADIMRKDFVRDFLSNYPMDDFGVFITYDFFV